MKKLLVIIGFLFVSYSCRSQELYIVIDTRDTVNMWCWVDSLPYSDYKKGEYKVEYFIKRKEIGIQYHGGGVLLNYEPYSDEKLQKWKNIKKLRTKKISVSQWKKLKRKENVRVVDGIEWVHSTPWDSIYRQMYEYYFHRGGMYIVDQKFTTQDSVQIRGVDYIDMKAEE